MADSLQPRGLQPTRLLHPWDFPGKYTGVGGHFLLQGISPTQDQIWVSCISCIARQTLNHLSHQGSPINSKVKQKSHSGNFKILLTDDENMTHKSLWDIARFKISENCIAINVDIRRREAKK